MTEVRMTLKDASELLGIAQNTLRSRYKAGKLRGERDNSGRLWIWIDPSRYSSRKPISKNAKQLLTLDQIGVLKEELAAANAELAVLRPRTSIADQLEAELKAVEAQIAMVREDRDHWRALAQELALARHPKRPGFWSRLFGKH